MIVEKILGFFMGIVAKVLDALPAISPPDLSGMVDAISPVWEYFGWANYYLPLDQLLVMLGISATAFAVFYVIKVTLWVLTKAHVLGGSSTD